MKTHNIKRGLLAAAVLALALMSLGAALLNPFRNYVLPNGTSVALRIQSETPAPPPGGGGGPGPGNPAMPPTNNFPVNGKAMILPRPGYSDLRIQPATISFGGNGPGASEGAGDFRIGCTTSHMLFDDPIVYPGQPNKSHMHTFFGNSDVSGNDTADTLANLRLHGRSTCAGGTANRSAYWVPTVIDKRTGFPIEPTVNVVYYKNGADWRSRAGGNIRAVTRPPNGLRMIAGKSSALEDQGTYFQKWQCFPASGSPLADPTGYIPPAEHCPNGGDLVWIVYFFECWDGVNLDSPDHASHMARQNWYTGCPSTHPVALPEISFNIHYKVDAKNRPENWRLSSDRYATSLPGGYSGHGDWINGWNPEVFEGMIENCLRSRRDCHANLLGDGTALY